MSLPLKLPLPPERLHALGSASTLLTAAAAARNRHLPENCRAPAGRVVADLISAAEDAGYLRGKDLQARLLAGPASAKTVDMANEAMGLVQQVLINAGITPDGKD